MVLAGKQVDLLSEEELGRVLLIWGGWREACG